MSKNVNVADRFDPRRARRGEGSACAPEKGTRRPRWGKGLFVLALFLAGGCSGTNPDTEKAQRDFMAGAYDSAAVAYERLLNTIRPGSEEEMLLRYNLGTTYYKLNRARAASASLLRVGEQLRRNRDTSPAFVFSAVYNLGNALYRTHDYARAADAYREALRVRPSDVDAKHNLELALEMLEEQSAAGGAPDSDTPQPSPRPGEGEPEPLPQRPVALSQEEAKRLLEMLGGEDVQRQRARLRNMMPPARNVEKDW